MIKTALVGVTIKFLTFKEQTEFSDNVYPKNIIVVTAAAVVFYTIFR